VAFTKVQAEGNTAEGVLLGSGQSAGTITLTRVAANENGDGDGANDDNVAIGGSANLAITADHLETNQSNGGSGLAVAETGAGTVMLNYAGASQSNDNAEFGLLINEAGNQGVTVINYAQLEANNNGAASFSTTAATITN